MAERYTVAPAHRLAAIRFSNVLHQRWQDEPALVPRRELCSVAGLRAALEELVRRATRFAEDVDAWSSALGDPKGGATESVNALAGGAADSAGALIAHCHSLKAARCSHALKPGQVLLARIAQRVLNTLNEGLKRYITIVTHPASARDSRIEIRIDFQGGPELEALMVWLAQQEPTPPRSGASAPRLGPPRAPAKTGGDWLPVIGAFFLGWLLGWSED